MFLLIDMEDLQPELRALGFDTPSEYRSETPYIQLLEALPDAGYHGRSQVQSQHHPVVVAQALTYLERTGDVPPAGKNIPETGQ
jgi:hypothetical protein